LLPGSLEKFVLFSLKAASMPDAAVDRAQAGSDGGAAQALTALSWAALGSGLSGIMPPAYLNPVTARVDA
jgi:hypothetical protein